MKSTTDILDEMVKTITIEVLEKEKARLECQQSTLQALIDFNGTDNPARVQGKIEGIRLAIENIRQSIKECS